MSLTDIGFKSMPTTVQRQTFYLTIFYLVLFQKRPHFLSLLKKEKETEIFW